ncbi:MAG TPA: MFS transporter [Chitinispirillaceae bacterium]|nr:MFS transporter [Chitinispirillaceae bacterium]
MRTVQQNKFRTVIAFISVITGFFMVMLDSTIVNITLPVMVRHFRTDMETISWVMNAYNLAFAILLLTGSRLADQFGRKKVFLIGVISFTFASILCGLSTSVEMLIFFRVLQGLSGSLLVPVSLPLVINLFPESKGGTVIGIWAGIAGIAAASGPALGGIISEFFTWQWVFFINGPIGVVAVVMVSLLIKESFDPTASKKIDFLGILFLTIAMFTVTLALIQSNEKGWSSFYILSLFITSLISTIAFIATEIKVQEPMLPMNLFANFNFCIAVLSIAMLGAALMCGVFLTSFFLTTVLGYSQLKAGLVITAYPAVSVLFSAISGILSDRFGYRWFAVSGAVLVCISLHLMGGLNIHSSINDVIVRLLVTGAAFGLAMPPLVTASMSASPKDKIGMASAVGNVTRTLGAILGVALLIMGVTHYSEQNVPKAQSEAVNTIMSSPVFMKEVKDTLVQKLTGTKFSSKSKLPTEKDIVSQFEKRRDEAVSKAPNMMKSAVEKIYEKQIKEVSRVYNLIKEMFIIQVSNSFSMTFKISSVVLLLLVVSSLFIEPFGKNRKRNIPSGKSFNSVPDSQEDKVENSFAGQMH